MESAKLEQLIERAYNQIINSPANTDEVDKIYGKDKFDDEEPELISTEPMVLLKMICPSTSHVHILRVPPEITSAEQAIFWVNHGIHPDEFAVET